MAACARGVLPCVIRARLGDDTAPGIDAGYLL